MAFTLKQSKLSDYPTSALVAGQYNLNANDKNYPWLAGQHHFFPVKWRDLYY
jgi:hypothetical protein